MKHYLKVTIAIIILMTSCEKTTPLERKFKSSDAQPVTLGTVIGFDQCSADAADSTSAGLIVKIQQVSGNDTMTIDTAFAFHWPKVFTFHPYLFINSGQQTWFSENMRTRYRFTFDYRAATKDEHYDPICAANLLLTDVRPWLENQIVITKVYTVYE